MIERSDIAKIENAILRGLRKAGMNRLGSGETGAQPDAGEGILPSPEPAVLTDSPQLTAALGTCEYALMTGDERDRREALQAISEARIEASACEDHISAIWDERERLAQALRLLRDTTSQGGYVYNVADAALTEVHDEEPEEEDHP